MFYHHSRINNESVSIGGKKMTKRLLTIIVISFVVVNGLILASMSILSYNKYFNVSSKEISKARLALVNQNLKEVTSFFDTISNAGAYLAINRGIMETLSKQVKSDYDAIKEQRDISKLMNDVTTLQEAIDSIEFYTDRYNHYTKLHDQKILPIAKLEREKWFYLFNRSDSGWTPKHKMVESEKMIISYIHRILNQQGKTIGYIKINILADELFNYISDYHLYYDTNEPFILFDKMARVIGQTNKQMMFPELFEQQEIGDFQYLKKEYVNIVNNYQMIKQGNEQYVLIVSDEGNDPWRLAHVIPIHSLYKDLKRIETFIIILVVVSLLLSIPIAYIIGRRIFKPIHTIINGMKEVEQGNYQVRVQPHYIEEYRILAINFNQMTQRLDESIQEIERKAILQKQAEIQTLQNQIVPHFLYNTLDMIHWRALDYQANDISYMVNQLSKMFRIGLSGGHTFIPLRMELEHVQCYMNIQEALSNKKINYQVRVPTKAKDVLIPKVILQPFVENSIKHGYVDKLVEEIKIEIKVNIQNNHLEIYIKDNGSGFPEHSQVKESVGIGMKNIQDRIALYYGKEFGMSYGNAKNGGAEIRLRLPIVHSEMGEKVGGNIEDRHSS